MWQVPRRTRNAAAVDAAASEYASCLTRLEALLKQADALTASLLPPGVPLQPPTAAAQRGSVRAREDAGYAVGRQLSLADAGFGPTFLYADLVFGALGVDRIKREASAGEWPRVAELRDALFSDPHVAAVLKELQPAANEWLESKLVQVLTGCRDIVWLICGLGRRPGDAFAALINTWKFTAAALLLAEQS
eukprot:366031-Chlamydomonas_euryale.AAC.20